VTHDGRTMMHAYMPGLRPLAVPGIGFLQTIPVGRNDSEAFGASQKSSALQAGHRTVSITLQVAERRADGSGKLIE
jgi:hypothetical protein